MWRDKTKWRWLTVVPAIALGLLIYMTAVNTPFWDEWELVPIFQHLHAGHFYWQDFWQQHNEHRIFFPTLLLVGLAHIDHWNLVVESFASLLLAVTSFWLLLKVMTRTAKNQWLLLAGLFSLIWFSPIQDDNWLWGWQVEWFMNVLGVMIAIYGLSRLSGAKVQWRDVGLIIAGSMLTQFSLGNGTLIWPIVIACLIYLRAEIRRLIVVVFGAVLATVFYYRHYAQIDKASETLARHHPRAYIHYLLLYFGRSLSFYRRPALLFGALLLLLFGWATVFILIKRKQLIKPALPWIALGLYSLGSGLVTGLARLSFGVDEAFSGRYTTIASLLLISTIMLLLLVWQTTKPTTEMLYKPLAAFSMVGILVLGNWAWGIHSSITHHRQQAANKSCTHLSLPLEQCLLQTYPNSQVVAPRLDFLKQVHWGGY